MKPALKPAAALLALAAVNLYLCGSLFSVEFTAHTNSIQGLWITMARLAGEQWFRPSWWPYQDAGVPFEHLYMPLVPASTALLAALMHWTAARAFHAVMALVLIGGPLTLYFMAWRITRLPGAAFWTALAYSVTSPARALLPEPDLNPVRYWSSLRIYTSIVWDDLPHYTAVCLLPLALFFLWRSLETRRPVYYVPAVLATALTVLASVFGATALIFAAVCMLSAFPRDRLRANLLLLAPLGGTAYLIVSPFLPPSVIAAIRANQQHFVEDRWTASSFLALAIFAAGYLAILYLLRQRAGMSPGAAGTSACATCFRFCALFAYTTAAIPLLDGHLNLHFLPQPNRYAAELELGVALIAVPGVAWISARLPRGIGAALAVFILCIAAEYLAGLHDFTVQIARPIDITRRIEYRVARWIDAQMPGQRVMVQGSMAQWFNVFSDTPQLSGGSYSTTPNWNQQAAMRAVIVAFNPAQVETAALWLKAFGVQAAAVVGPYTSEFWKGNSSIKFDGRFPVLWRGEDTTVYRVPQRSPSLAHVIPGSAAGDLRRFAAALDDPALPLAPMRWLTLRSAAIEATAAPGQLISIQTAYDSGWHAAANGRTVEVRRDALGLLLIDPHCTGPCHVDLTYTGSMEFWACRILSVLALLGLAAFAVRT